MAVSAALVYAGHNILRYLITGTGIDGAETGVITTTGAASPDLRTDSLQGPIKQAALAFDQGVGNVPAGGLTQDQARSLWLSDNIGADVGNADVPRCVVRLAPRASYVVWVDANEDGSGNPIIEYTFNADGEAYLDIEAPGAIGA
jgi:hypothetical protein